MLTYGCHVRPACPDPVRKLSRLAGGRAGKYLWEASPLHSTMWSNRQVIMITYVQWVTLNIEVDMAS